MFINLLENSLHNNGYWSNNEELRLFSKDLGRLQNELSKGLFQERYSKTEPAINYYVNDDGAEVSCLVPGFEENQIEISINDKKLEISGKRDKEVLGENTKVILDEISTDEFTRTIELPFRVETDKVEAKYRNGFLNIYLPKAESEKPKRIKVN